MNIFFLLLQRHTIGQTVVIGAISFAFLLCWGPYFGFSMYWLCRYEQNKHRDILMLLVSIGYINSLVNPLLYIAVSKDIRTIIYSVITCKKDQNSRLRTETLSQSKKTEIQPTKNFQHLKSMKPPKLPPQVTKELPDQQL